LNYRNYSAHALRKTWGYQARAQGKAIEQVSPKLEHRSTVVTRRYIGIAQDEINQIKDKVNLHKRQCLIEISIKTNIKLFRIEKGDNDIYIITISIFCKHLNIRPDIGKNDEKKATCKAFPKKITKGILFNETIGDKRIT
jgi:argonaute-like protein implicated in RNA metabolism and viral defense